jgi:hypothetical protein
MTGCPTGSVISHRALQDLAIRPHAVVWPENMLTTGHSTNSEPAAELQKWVDLWNTDLITGIVRPAVGAAEGLYRSSVIWIEPGRGIVDAIDKERAVPVVESSRVESNDGFAIHYGATLWRSCSWAEGRGSHEQPTSKGELRVDTCPVLRSPIRVPCRQTSQQAHKVHSQPKRRRLDVQKSAIAPTRQHRSIAASQHSERSSNGAPTEESVM